MNTENSICAHPLIQIVCTVIGSGAIISLVSWLLRKLDQRKDLKQEIESSPTIRRFEANNWNYL